MDVWIVPLDVAPQQLERLVASLNATERARAARYRFPDDARRFSAARGWLRHVLGFELGTAPATVPLTEGTGKPRLLRRPAPCFNASRARELALIAVADGEVGVDLEHRDRGRCGLDAAKLVLTPAEAAALDGLPLDERAEAFLCCWTAKEAYLKARGLGLAVPPHRVEIGAPRIGEAAPVRMAGEPGQRRWSVRNLRPAEAYVGAVVAEGRNWVVTLRDPAEIRLGRCGSTAFCR